MKYRVQNALTGESCEIEAQGPVQAAQGSKWQMEHCRVENTEDLMVGMANNLLTVREVSRYMQMHANTVRRMAREGRLPALRLGNDWRFMPEEIKKFIDRGKICRVMLPASMEVDSQKLPGSGRFYRPGEEIPGLEVSEYGVFLGTREEAEAFMRLYPGLLVVS